MIHGLPGYGSRGEIGNDGKRGMIISYIDDITNFNANNSISYGDIVIDKNNTQWVYLGYLGFKELSKFNISSAFAYNDKSDIIHTDNKFILHNILSNTNEFVDNIQSADSVISNICELDGSILSIKTYDASTQEIKNSVSIDSSNHDFHIHSANIDNLYVSGSGILSHEYGYYIIDEIKRSLTYNKNEKRFNAPLFDNFEYMLFFSRPQDGVLGEFSCIKSFKDFAIVDGVDYDNLDIYTYKIVIKSNINGTGYLVDSYFTLYPEYYNIVSINAYDKSNNKIENAILLKGTTVEILCANYNNITIEFDQNITVEDGEAKYIQSNANLTIKENQCIISTKDNFYLNVTGTTYNFVKRNNTGNIKYSFSIDESKNDRLYYSKDLNGVRVNEIVEVYDINLIGSITSGSMIISCSDNTYGAITSDISIKLYTSNKDFSSIRDKNGDLFKEGYIDITNNTAFSDLSTINSNTYNKLIVYRKINSSFYIGKSEPVISTKIIYENVKLYECDESFSSNEEYKTGVIRWNINAMTGDKIKNALDYDLRVYNKLRKVDNKQFGIGDKNKSIKIGPKDTIFNYNISVYSSQSFLKIGYDKHSRNSALSTDNVNYDVYLNGNDRVTYGGPASGYMNMDYPMWTDVSFDIDDITNGDTFYSPSTKRGGNLSPLENGIIISSKFDTNLKNDLKKSDILYYACLGKHETILDGSTYITNSVNFSGDDFAEYYVISPRSMDIDNASKVYDKAIHVLTGMYIGDSSAYEFYIDSSAKKYLDASQYTISMQLLTGNKTPTIKQDPSIAFPPISVDPVPTDPLPLPGVGGNITPVGGGFVQSGNSTEELTHNQLINSNEGEINLR